MSHPGQLVLLTRCEDVPGFPALLAAALSTQGAPYFPEYYVYEEYRAFGQTRYCCQVHVLNEAGTRDRYECWGFGITPEQSVHEAAYCALPLRVASRVCPVCNKPVCLKYPKLVL